MKNDSITRPKYQITEIIHALSLQIAELIGQYEVLEETIPRPKLRKRNRIKTIHSSCAIEGNTLTVDQVTALLDGKRILAPRRDIVEVQNAFAAYEKLHHFDPYEERSLLEAHHILMGGLVNEAGKWRGGQVAVMKGQEVVHMAPPAKRVPGLMVSLFQWLHNAQSINPLISSAIFHYEFEFIHPFVDGNGRVGRLWHHLILTRYRQVFEHVPMESAIHDKQQEYYQALRESTAKADVTPFIEYSLITLYQATKQYLDELKKRYTKADRLEYFRNLTKKKWFSKKDYLQANPDIASATAGRDLRAAVEAGMLERRGEQATTKYRFLS